MSITREVAVFTSNKQDYEIICDGIFECNDAYTRITEYKEIEFELLPYGVVEKRQLELIDLEIKAELANHNVKIDELEKRKNDLLAIGHDK